MDRGLAYIPANHNGYVLSEASACVTLDFFLRVFTTQVDLQNWHLSKQKTIVAGNARAVSEGRVWDKSGRLNSNMTRPFCGRVLNLPLAFDPRGTDLNTNIFRLILHSNRSLDSDLSSSLLRPTLDP